MNLFPDSHCDLNLKLAHAKLYPSFLKEDAARVLFKRLVEEIRWEQNKIKLFGKFFDEPRLTAFFAQNSLAYTYSKTKREGLEFPESILEMLTQINTKFNTRLNSCLVNYYRNGQDSMGWHSDDETELGKNPTIVALSLGSERFFHIKSKHGNERLKIKLENGSLLFMGQGMQANYLHQIPKTKKPIGGRISLTFREIKER